MIFDARTTTLIGLATAVSANCQPCLDIYMKKAKENGISDVEMKEAINIGKSVKKGAAVGMDNFVAGTTPAENPCCAVSNPCAPQNPCSCG